MTGLSRPGWLFLHKRVEHVWISPPGSAGAWAERGRGRWLEHDGSGPARVTSPSQKIRTCEDLAASLGWGFGSSNNLQNI